MKKTIFISGVMGILLVLSGLFIFDPSATWYAKPMILIGAVVGLGSSIVGLVYIQRQKHHPNDNDDWWLEYTP